MRLKAVSAVKRIAEAVAIAILTDVARRALDRLEAWREERKSETDAE